MKALLSKMGLSFFYLPLDDDQTGYICFHGCPLRRNGGFCDN